MITSQDTCIKYFLTGGGPAEGKTYSEYGLHGCTLQSFLIVRVRLFILFHRLKGRATLPFDFFVPNMSHSVFFSKKHKDFYGERP